MEKHVLQAGLALGLLLLPLVVRGQVQEPNLREKFAQAQQENTAALRQYTWKSRTTLSLKGETKKVKLDQVQYDAAGQLQKTSLQDPGQPAAAEQQPSGGGRRGGRLKQHIVEKKKEEFADLLQDLVKLVTSYAHIPPERMQAFLQGAQFSGVEGDEPNVIQISGKDALQAGDAMRIWIDKQTLMTRRVEIDTALEKKPVHLVAEYKTIPQGPTYQAHAELTYPEKELRVLIDNFEHQRIAQ